MIDKLIDNPKTEILEFLKNKYNINVIEITGSDNLLNISISGMLALRYWREKFNYNSNIYFDEIISNINQSLILSLLGFKVASLILLRRCLENILAFIYYKDHKIEFIKKELDVSKKTFNKMEELLNYVSEYPFSEFLTIDKQDDFNKLIQDLKSDWQSNYKELSNYVHSSNTKYLDMHSFLSDIVPTEEGLVKIKETTEKTVSFINALNIILFKNEYDLIDETGKTLIRNSINTTSYKTKIIECLGEI